MAVAGPDALRRPEAYAQQGPKPDAREYVAPTEEQ